MDPFRRLVRLSHMDTFQDEAKLERFRRAVGRIEIDREPQDTRCLDGNTEVRRAQVLTARERVVATASSSPGRPVVAGIAASVLHGSLWFDPEFRIELLHDLKGSSRHGIGRMTHRYQLASSEYMELDGLLVTTPIRTAFDIGRVTPEWRGLGYLDALHRATAFSIPALVRYVEAHPGWRHIRQLRAIAPLIDGKAESPPESWLRLLMIRGDLPAPETQIVIPDDKGYEFARADLGYREQKIGIEYDGDEYHSTEAQRAHDEWRDTKLRNLGWKVIRVDARRYFDDPCGILVEIEKALHARGAY